MAPTPGDTPTTTRAPGATRDPDTREPKSGHRDDRNGVLDEPSTQTGVRPTTSTHSPHPEAPGIRRGGTTPPPGAPPPPGAARDPDTREPKSGRPDGAHTALDEPSTQTGVRPTAPTPGADAKAPRRERGRRPARGPARP
ncbi:hypothetical protein GCM10010269_31050 [Streptomyces humidus]|uniref:Uncharacterized protein n=1 Tax=Streptomyces humidus TaxID=52259 RepID=A0A918L3Z6_9ACTN|nr:hypothetical protein GCM10010269_31050 [Streptomyces humidus]